MFVVNNPTIHEAEHIIDEKRKLIINTRDLNSFQYNLYRRSMFKRQRPDLSEYDFLIWKEKYRMGEYYINELNRRLNLEIGRAFLMGHQAQNKENIKYFEEQALQLSQPHIKGPGWHVERTWEEASKIVAYMTKLSNRVQKYRLEYPLARSFIDAQTAKVLEDEVTERLVREMRKPPRAAAEEESE